jgi:hypothetical protein
MMVREVALRPSSGTALSRACFANTQFPQLFRVPNAQVAGGGADT